MKRITMPALSPTMESGNLARWCKSEGDAVQIGDVIAEIETDKAVMEVEAVDEGILGKILVAAGTEGVAVNTTIGVIAEDGEDPASLSLGPDVSSGPVAEAKPADEAKPQPQAAPRGEPLPAPPKPASAPAKASPHSGSGGRIFASPLARRRASDGGLDLSSITGSGPHGRIVVRDVEAALLAPRAASVQSSSVPTGGLFAPAVGEPVSLDGMRKTIASRLTLSKTTIPHFYLEADCELDKLLAVRAEANASFVDSKGEAKIRLSVNDFLIKALALSLVEVPQANAIWDDGQILRFGQVDIGVAVAVEGGLFTPVIRAAEQISIARISSQMKDLAGRARKRKLLPEDYAGGVTSISNLGMFGVDRFSAVINPPQSTILAVGAGSDQARVRDGKIKIVNLMSVTLSCDHRVVDGALAAQMLSAFREMVHSPLRLLIGLS